MRTIQGGQLRYSSLAIAAALTLRSVFRTDTARRRGLDRGVRQCRRQQEGRGAPLPPRRTEIRIWLGYALCGMA